MTRDLTSFWHNEDALLRDLNYHFLNMIEIEGVPFLIT